MSGRGGGRNPEGVLKEGGYFIPHSEKKKKRKAL
jgi:hypothetical protein